MCGRNEHKEKIEKVIKQRINNDKIMMGYYNYLDMLSMQPSSKKLYIQYTNSFMNFVNKQVNKVEVNDVFEYFQSLKKGDKRQTYLTTTWFALNKFFEYLYSVKIVKENPMQFVPKPKPKRSREVKRFVLSSEELVELLNSVDNGVGTNKAKKCQKNTKERDKAIIATFMNTGIRCEALSEIDINDIDFNNKKIIITDKGNKTIEYVINDFLYKYLIEYYSIREKMGIDTKALFINNKGQRLTASGVAKVVNKFGSIFEEKYNRKLTPHKIRASFATNLYNATGDIRLVQQAMNHESMTTTQIYVSSLDRNKEKTSDVMQDLYSSAM